MDKEQWDWESALDARKQLLELLIPLDGFLSLYTECGDFKELRLELKRVINITTFGIKTCKEQITYCKQRGE